MLELNLAAVEGLMPDRTILLDDRRRQAAARMGAEAGSTGSSARATSFRAPRRGRRTDELAERFPERYVTVDGTAVRPRHVAEEIHGAVRRGP